MRKYAKCPWLTQVVAHMIRYRRPYTVAEIVARFHEPESGITAEKKISSACGAGFFTADRSGPVTRYTATGKPYGVDKPEPTFAGLDALGWSQRDPSVWHRAQRIGAQA